MRLYVTDRGLYITEDETLVAGSVREYTVIFAFSPAWEDYEKTAVFQTQAGELYEVALTDDACLIPWQVLTEPQYIKIGIRGTKGAQVRPTLWYEKKFVEPGAENAEPNPQRESWEAIQAALEQMDADLTASETARDAASDEADRAETAAGRAEDAAEDAAEALASIPEDYSALSADAEDLKSALEEYNSTNVLPRFTGNDGTLNGITYSVTDGYNWTLSGTATANVNRNLYKSEESLPDWFAPGNVLRIRLNKSGNVDAVRLVIYAYDGENPTIDDRYMQTTVDTDYVVPDTLLSKPGLMVRLYIGSGSTVDGTMRPKIVVGMPNSDIVALLSNLQTDSLKYIAHPEQTYAGKTLAEIDDNIVCMPARADFPAPDTAASGPFINLHYVASYNLQIQVSNTTGKIYTRIIKRSDASVYRDWVPVALKSDVDNQGTALENLTSTILGRFSNKKVYCDGDSIMVGVITTSPEYPSRTVASPNIPDAIAARLPNATVDNKAHGGDYIRSMNDASVSICDSILADSTVGGYDYFVINGGTNDYSNDRGSNPTTLGTIDSTDTATFYGAYNAIMQYIFAQNPKARVLLITPCFRNYMHSTRGNAYEIQNEQGITLGDFCDAVVNIGKKYAVPVYDSRVLGPINAWNYTTLLVPRTNSGTDAHIHPSQDGYTLYGDSIASYFIANN